MHGTIGRLQSLAANVMNGEEPTEDMIPIPPHRGEWPPKEDSIPGFNLVTESGVVAIFRNEDNRLVAFIEAGYTAEVNRFSVRPDMLAGAVPLAKATLVNVPNPLDLSEALNQIDFKYAMLNAFIKVLESYQGGLIGGGSNTSYYRYLEDAIAAIIARVNAT